jgi:hypothetical protein
VRHGGQVREHLDAVVDEVRQAEPHGDRRLALPGAAEVDPVGAGAGAVEEPVPARTAACHSIAGL